MRLEDAFALVLRHARARVGLTQADIALRAGLTSRYIRSLEAGKACPSLGAVFSLASALEVNPHELIAMVHAQINATTSTQDEPQG